MKRALFIIVPLLVVAGIAWAVEVNTSGRCTPGAACEIGTSNTGALTLGGSGTDSVTLDTDGADLSVDVTGNAAVLTATTTASPTFIGADAATPADTIFDTTGTGTVQVGSADVTGVTLTTDGASLNIEGTTANTLTLTAATTGTMTILGADAAGASNTTLDTSGAGAIIIGSADVTSVTITTDGLGGSVVLDGSVLAQVPAASVASGAIAINSVTLATAAADYDIPDGACNAAADVGTWVTIVAEDDTTLISITSDDASNSFFVPGLDIAAGNELDNVVTAAHEGQNITLTCLAADQWYMTAGALTLGDGTAIAWADGGAAD